MSLVATTAQILIALGIFNVWILRRDRPTGYRPEGASSIGEEFRSYGFPDWLHVFVGVTKVGLAAALLVGIVYAQIALPAAVLMAALMVGAVWAHVRVGDPWVKSVPALGMLFLSGLVIGSHVA